MRKNLLSIFIFVFVFSLIPLGLSFAADGEFAGGVGSGGDPYQIEDCLDLQAMNNSLSSSYILNNDIDCSATATWNDGAGFVRVGNPGAKFTGGFDGNGYVIEDLTINVSDTAYVGLFGWVNITTEGGTIRDVGLVNANITATSYSSTLIGWLEAGTVTNTYSTGSVTTPDGSYIGGLVGSVAAGTLSNSYSTASVNGGNIYAGGLIGIQQGGTVQYSYSTGSVNAGLGGGLIGLKSAGTLTNSFYDSTTSGKSDNTGKGTPKTTAQMKTQSTFTGWTFTVAGNGTIGDWIMAGYPHLQMEHRATITSAVELQLMAVDLDGDYSIANDIDATAVTNYLPMGSSIAPFTGSLDGNGYLIQNLVINQPDLISVGIVGYSYGATFVDIGYASGSVTGNKWSGGIVGYAGASSISRSFSLVDVASTNEGDSLAEAGGLVGVQSDGGTISDSYATGNVTTFFDGGGLVGYIDGTVTRVYASGSVTGGDNHGGLIGRTDAGAGVLSNSFSAATVGAADSNRGGLVGSHGVGASISASYWNSVDGGPTNCYGSGNTGCTAIDDNVSYFYDLANAPMTAWTFSETWKEVSESFPVLTAFDRVAPTITNVSSDTADGSYTIGDVIDIDVTFSEWVTTTGSVTVTLETGDTDRTCTFTVSDAPTGTCDYTVQADDASLDLAVSSIAGTIADANGNAMSNFVPTTTLATNKAFIIDTVVPTAAITYSPVQSTYSQGNQLTITAIFSEAMADSPVPKIALTGANTLAATAMTKTDTTHYTYSHTVGSGNGTANVVLSIGTDVAGNVITATPTSGENFQVSNSGGGYVYSNQNSKNSKLETSEDLKPEVQSEDMKEILFDDIADSYAQDEIKQLFEMNIVKGRAEFKFAPNEPLTRAEALKIILLALNYPLDANIDDIKKYDDVDRIAWYSQYVFVATEAGIVIGFQDNTFRPDSPVTRAEAVKILLSSMGASFKNPKSSPFVDVSFDSWFKEYVDYAYILGLVKGKTADTFAPNDYLLRSEIAVLVVRAMNITDGN